MAEGRFFEKKPKEEGLPKKDYEEIKEVDKLKQFYDMQNKNYSDSMENSWKTLTPFVEELFRGKVNDPRSTGKVNDLLDEIEKDWRMDRMGIGIRMKEVLQKVKDFSGWAEDLRERSDEFIEVFLYIIKCAFSIIEEQKEFIEKAKQEGYLQPIQGQPMPPPMPRPVGRPPLQQQPQYQQQYPPQQQPYPPQQYPQQQQIPPNYQKNANITQYQLDLEPDLTEDRKRTLEELYDTCQNAYQFGLLVNPKRDGKNFTQKEIRHLKEHNIRVRKFVGQSATNTKAKPQNIKNLPKIDDITKKIENPENQEEPQTQNPEDLKGINPDETQETEEESEQNIQR